MIRNKRSFRLGFYLLPALAGMIFCVPNVARAQDGPGAQFSGAYMREICKSNKDGDEIIEGGHAACQAYIAGVLDYHGTLKALGTDPSLSICFPGKVPIRKMQDIVWRYIERNPPVDAFAAAPVVIMSLAEAYPCKRNSKR